MRQAHSSGAELAPTYCFSDLMILTRSNCLTQRLRRISHVAMICKGPAALSSGAPFIVSAIRNDRSSNSGSENTATKPSLPCAWCLCLTQRSTKWSSVVSFRAGSTLPRAACAGTSGKSIDGSKIEGGLRSQRSWLVRISRRTEAQVAACEELAPVRVRSDKGGKLLMRHAVNRARIVGIGADFRHFAAIRNLPLYPAELRGQPAT